MIDALLMTDTPPVTCWFCGATTAPRDSGLCARCQAVSRWVQCANCDQHAPHRGRGLCGRCYQRLARTGMLPPPNLTTPEEVLRGA